MTTSPTTPKVKILPPTLLVMLISAGLVLDFLVPLDMGRGVGWLGLVLFSFFIGVTAWCKDLFKKAGTNIPPNQPATAIVTGGPYQFSRNPIYAAGVLGFIGLALMADAPLMLLLTLPLVYILQEQVIKPEEEYLEATFGDDYTNFKSRVRRWI